MKDIKDFENQYAITEDGKVWSYKCNRFLSPKNKRGYLSVDLYKDGVKTQIQIHRLVANAYIPNPNNYSIINHKDENRKNNSVDNLEWCTYSYNNSYGTRIEKVREKNRINQTYKYMVEARKKKVKCLENGVVYESSCEAGRQLGVCGSKVNSCCNGNRKSTGKLHFVFA